MAPSGSTSRGVRELVEVSSSTLLRRARSVTPAVQARQLHVDVMAGAQLPGEHGERPKYWPPWPMWCASARGGPGTQSTTARTSPWSQASSGAPLDDDLVVVAAGGRGEECVGVARDLAARLHNAVSSLVVSTSNVATGGSISHQCQQGPHHRPRQVDPFSSLKHAAARRPHGARPGCCGPSVSLRHGHHDPDRAPARWPRRPSPGEPRTAARRGSGS